jgi:hypothetical protein
MKPSWEAERIFPVILLLAGQRVDKLSAGEVELQLGRNGDRRGGVSIEALCFSAECAVGVLCSFVWVLNRLYRVDLSMISPCELLKPGYEHIESNKPNAESSVVTEPMKYSTNPTSEDGNGGASRRTHMWTTKQSQT